MKKILVTGATGFVGNYVVDELLRMGHNVIASSASMQKAMSRPWYDRVQYIEFDLRSLEEERNYFKFFAEPDILIHLAWEGLPNYTNEFHVAENLPRHAAFLENMVANGLKDMTVTGTCFEYGMKEGSLHENLEASPANAYAVAKNKLRKKLEQLTNEHAFALKWVRLFYMYGKGQNPQSLISQLDKAIENNEPVFNMSGGEQVRDFLPVQKAAGYIVAIALQQKVNGIINCCSAVPVTVKDFVEAYLEQAGKTIILNLGYYDYAAYEPMRFWGDNNRLNLVLKK